MYPFDVVQHWISYWTGSANAPGIVHNYNFWSGFGSDLGEYIVVAAVLTGLYHVIRARNCETHKCWRISLHKTAAGHRVCHRHNPDGKLSHNHILAAHFKELERRGDGRDV